MAQDRKKQLQDTIDHLTTGLLMDGARIQTLEDVVLRLCAKAGLDAIDGIPIGKWMAEQNRERLNKVTFFVEDLSPEEAARIQAVLNRGVETALQMKKKDQDVS